MPYVPRLPRKVTIHVAKCHACVSKLYVCKLCVSKLRVSKLCVNKLCVSRVPRLPRETKVDVTKCHACHAKWRSMSPSATPAWVSCMCASCAWVSCVWVSCVWTSCVWVSRVPHLPRETKVDVTRPLGHVEPSAPPELAQCHMCHACHAKWVSRVPRLPRETKVDVTKCHVCHVKRRWMSPSATPATQKAAATTRARGNRARHQSQPNAIRATPATQSEQVEYHACHVKRRWMSPSATPATWNEDEGLQLPRLPRKKPRRPLGHVGTERATRASPVPYVPRLPRKVSKSSTTPATWNEGGCHQVPRLPRETKMNVSKCHTCHAKSRGDHSGTWEPSAPPEPAQCHTCHACHAKWVSRVPRLPRETKVDVTKCHACHVKQRWRSPSATPATQKAAATTRARGNRARHQSQPSAIRATPATWNEGGCLKVPRLPRKVQLHVSKCHACHASATPATVCE